MVAINKIKTDLVSIDYIFHLADIHIRNIRRHEEYRLVFNKFFDDIKTRSHVNETNSIIVIAGDIAHAKTDMSPELVAEISNFLLKCSEMLYTIVTLGNHDCSSNNRNRLDVLTPITSILNTDRLLFLKDTGVYKIGNCYFNVMNFLDSTDKFITGKQLSDKVGKKIAIFHGPVYGSQTETGYRIEGRSIELSLFDNHDIVLLGDIHKYQILQDYKTNYVVCDLHQKSSYIKNGWKQLYEDNNNFLMSRYDETKPIVVYPGSLVCQNYGESVDNHGYCLWDLKESIPTVKFIEIPNDYSYVTIDVKNGEFDESIFIPKNARVRLRHLNTSFEQLNEILLKIKRNRELEELNIIKVSAPIDLTVDSNKINGKINFSDLINIDYQNSLIKEHLELIGSNVKDLSPIYSINEEINKQLQKSDALRDIMWIPEEFKFSNMFSYGEDNLVDFSKLKGIVGIFGKNATGKTSFGEAMSFTLFDKCSKSFKASDIINIAKNGFKTEFVFSINGKRFSIERSGTKKKNSSNVPVTVEFSSLTSDGKKESLNSNSRRSTNDVIRDYIGSYDDFILTSLSLQGNNNIFIETGQSNRKDIFSQFMGIDIFDKLATICSNNIRDLENSLKGISLDSISSELKENISLLERKESLYNTLSDSNSNIDAKLSELMIKKDQLLKDYNEVFNSVNITVLNNMRDSLVTKIKNIKSDIIMLDSSGIEQELNSICSSDIDSDAIQESYNKHIQLTKKHSKLENEIGLLESSILSKIQKLEHLEKHEYDPNCKFCMNNVFVKDAISVKETLVSDKDKYDQLNLELEDVVIQLNAIKDAEVNYKNLIKYQQKVSELKDKLNKNVIKVQKLESELLTLEGKLESIESQIENYTKNQEIIINNNEIKSKLSVIETEIKKLEREKTQSNSQLMNYFAEISVIKNKIQTLRLKIEDVRCSETKLQNYKLYFSTMHRDGIPYQLIKKTIPIVESEVNYILSQISDFSVSMKMEAKTIDVKICYENREWSLEMASGMEKFVTSLALRIALMNISNLPRPNFLIVDEGWAACDSDNLISMSNLFSYLRTRFDFVLVISHLEIMRDMVDTVLEIKKDGEFSKLIYN